LNWIYTHLIRNLLEAVEAVHRAGFHLVEPHAGDLAAFVEEG
jgi:hypothetical protein